MTVRAAAVVMVCLAAAFVPASAKAQSGGTRAVAFDTTLGVQDYFDDAGAWKTQLIVDPFASAAIAPGLQVLVRPLFWRAMTGQWENYLAQASVRYEFEKGSKWRVEAGKFTSPIGLGMTENRASVNDSVIWWHRSYYSPLPSLGGGAARHSLIASIYPVGVQVNTSRDHWDARAAFTDRAPADFFHNPGAPRRANGIVGAGITPRQGMRFGMATAWGRSGDALTAEPYRMVNVEGEYAFAYTKISGEWTHDRFDVAAGVVTARGMTLQAKQTITPRIYLHSRGSVIESGVLALPAGSPGTRTSWYLDTTLGLLVSPEATIRLAHSAIRRSSATVVDNQIGVSIVWAKRWW